jgi:hypothetical protein
VGLVHPGGACMHLTPACLPMVSRLLSDAGMHCQGAPAALRPFAVVVQAEYQQKFRLSSGVVCMSMHAAITWGALCACVCMLHPPRAS